MVVQGGCFSLVVVGCFAFTDIVLIPRSYFSRVEAPQLLPASSCFLVLFYPLCWSILFSFLESSPARLGSSKSTPQDEEDPRSFAGGRKHCREKWNEPNVTAKMRPVVETAYRWLVALINSLSCVRYSLIDF